jgi:hypothetical protein
MIRLSQPSVRVALIVLFLGGTLNTAFSVTKPHVITLGKWATVPWFPASGIADEKPLNLKVRPLLVDTRVKEFTLGPPHDISERLFVIRRAFRVNDSLPQESAAPPRWQWQRGGWLLVDRLTGHVSPINLPEFDAFSSAASWYRDYTAYCGVSDDGKKIYAIVAQISRRKPVLKKLLDTPGAAETDLKNASPDSTCSVPEWQRSPTRVTFEPSGATKQTFSIRGHAVDLVPEDADDEDASK